MEFIWPVRVYYEDTDSGGVVYHSNYLNFMERARTEWLRTLDLEQDEIIKKYGIVFVVSALSINYLKPALFNDLLQVKSTLKKLTRASIVFEQSIVRANKNAGDEILTHGEVKVVSFNQYKKRPAAFPESIYNNFIGLKNAT